MRRHILTIMTFVALTTTAQAVEVRLTVTEVTDSRSTGQFHNGTQVKLKLTGDDAVSVKAVRTTVTKAVDEVGRNLLTEERPDKDFSTIRDMGTGPEITLRLKNPARRATTIKEIVGVVQLFMPDQDPSATVLVKNFRTLTGKPLADPLLKKAGLQLTVLSKTDYQSLEKQKREEARKKLGNELGEAMVQSLEGMLDGFFRVGENDLILKFSDSALFVHAEVVDGIGKVIETTFTTYADDMRVLSYENPLPPDARLRIFLKTGKSVATVPLKLTDVALP